MIPTFWTVKEVAGICSCGGTMTELFATFNDKSANKIEFTDYSEQYRECLKCGARKYLWNTATRIT